MYHCVKFVNYISTLLIYIVKIKSIENIENSIIQVTRENELLEKQLQDTKSRMKEVRENIVRYICYKYSIAKYYLTFYLL